jgi:hypothetical protein
MENYTELDIHFEPEEKERPKEINRGHDNDYLDDIASLDRDKLDLITRRAIEEKRIEEEEVSPELVSQIEAKAHEVAYNILEWVYLAAETGEWKFVYDMNRLDRMYLAPTVRALRAYLPGVFIRVQNSSMNRWIEVNWKSSNEV